jgi:hypothetical protein
MLVWNFRGYAWLDESSRKEVGYPPLSTYNPPRNKYPLNPFPFLARTHFISYSGSLKFHQLKTVKAMEGTNQSPKKIFAMLGYCVLHDNHPRVEMLSLVTMSYWLYRSIDVLVWIKLYRALIHGAIFPSLDFLPVVWKNWKPTL